VSADVLPLTLPSRAELWLRLQLARSVLGHRPPGQTTVALLLRVLDGESIESLIASGSLAAHDLRGPSDHLEVG
jgi:hypothetical protein